MEKTKPVPQRSLDCNRKALEKVVGAVEEKELLDTLKSVAKLRVRRLVVEVSWKTWVLC